MTESECRAAAKSRGTSLQTETDSDYPPRCYLHNRNSVYFNHHASGSSQSSSIPMCQASCFTTGIDYVGHDVKSLINVASPVACQQRCGAVTGAKMFQFMPAIDSKPSVCWCKSLDVGSSNLHPSPKSHRIAGPLHCPGVDQGYNDLGSGCCSWGRDQWQKPNPMSAGGGGHQPDLKACKMSCGAQCSYFEYWPGKGACFLYKKSAACDAKPLRTDVAVCEDHAHTYEKTR